MADDSKGTFLVSAIALIAIGAAGYFVYRQMSTGAPALPPISASREELVKAAMGDSTPRASGDAKSSVQAKMPGRSNIAP